LAWRACGLRRSIHGEGRERDSGITLMTYVSTREPSPQSEQNGGEIRPNPIKRILARADSPRTTTTEREREVLRGPDLRRSTPAKARARRETKVPVRSADARYQRQHHRTMPESDCFSLHRHAGVGKYRTRELGCRRRFGTALSSTAWRTYVLTHPIGKYARRRTSAGSRSTDDPARRATSRPCLPTSETPPAARLLAQALAPTDERGTPPTAARLLSTLSNNAWAHRVLDGGRGGGPSASGVLLAGPHRCHKRDQRLRLCRVKTTGFLAGGPLSLAKPGGVEQRLDFSGPPR